MHGRRLTGITAIANGIDDTGRQCHRREDGRKMSTAPAAEEDGHDTRKKNFGVIVVK